MTLIVDICRLTVTVREGGLEAQAKLYVVVKDVNDHKPKFNRQKNSVPLSMEVEEELDIGSSIGQVEAIDQDIGENAVIDYAIVGRLRQLQCINL